MTKGTTRAWAGAVLLFLSAGSRADPETAPQGFDGARGTWKLSLPPAPSAAGNGPAKDGLSLSPEEALEIGKRIWANEGGTRRFLTHWNHGESFASLGIGHFIWYPLGMEGPFVEGFPPMLDFLEARGVAIPDWLAGGVPCPWDTREEFYRDYHTRRVAELRKLLSQTIDLQAQFIARRVENALPAMLSTIPAAERARVGAQFARVAQAPGGAYALVDYVNFKGEGVAPTERYRGRGWGLLQVLQEMTASARPSRSALDDFADAAADVLRRRVQNAPRRRREERWLATWLRRVEAYRGPVVPTAAGGAP